MTPTEKEEFLDDVESIVLGFLMQEEANASGLKTYIEGTVHKTEHGTLEWSTPIVATDYTARGRNKRGAMLYNMVQEAMQTANVDKIRFEKQTIAFERYETYIFFVDETSKKITI